MSVRIKMFFSWMSSKSPQCQNFGSSFSMNLTFVLSDCPWESISQHFTQLFSQLVVYLLFPMSCRTIIIKSRYFQVFRPIKHDQAMLWRHLFEGNHLCQQPSDDCLIATSGLAKNRGLGGTYSVFAPICPPPLPMPSPSLNSHWTKRTRVA